MYSNDTDDDALVAVRPELPALGENRSRLQRRVPVVCRFVLNLVCGCVYGCRLVSSSLLLFQMKAGGEVEV